MHPNVAAARGFGGQPVILQVVAPHQDQKAVIRHKLHRLGGGRRLLPAAAAPQIPARRQLFPQFGQIAIGVRAGQRVKHRIDVGQLLFACGDLFGQYLLGGLRLAVLLVVFLRVRRSGQRRIQRHRDGGASRIVVIDQFRLTRALGNRVQIGVDEIAVQAALLAFGGLAQLLPLVLQLAGNAVARVGQQLQHIVGALFHALGFVLVGVKRIQQLRKAVHFVPDRR